MHKEYLIRISKHQMCFDMIQTKMHKDGLMKSKSPPVNASPLSFPYKMPLIQHLLKIILFSVSVPVLSVKMYSTCPRSSLIAVLQQAMRVTKTKGQDSFLTISPHSTNT